MIDIPTVFVLISLISLSLGGSILLVSSTEPGSGLKQLAYGLLLHGSAYLALVLSGRPGPSIIWAAEVLIALFFAFALKAIGLFHQVRVPAVAYVALVGPVVVTSALFADNIEMRILLNSPVLAAVEVVVLWMLMGRRQATTGRGQYLVIGAVALNCLSLFYREYSAAAGLVRIKLILDPDVSQTILYLSVLMGLVLLSIGFVLMTKERTDHINNDLILRDKLTGLWNRRKIEEAGTAELRRHIRYGTSATLFVLDLDNFKSMNDRFGHGAGDDVLKAVADVLGGFVRETDLVGRWGGEEFVVILPGTGVDDATLIAERLRHDIAAIDPAVGRGITVTIGVSLCISSDDWQTWFDRADAALYRAKAAGKNRSFFQLPIDREEGLARIRWTNALMTDIPELDADHRRIVDQANDLLRLVNGNYGKEEILSALVAIEATTLDHFIREEKLIGELRPDLFVTHCGEHRALTERLRFLQGRFQADALPLDSLVQFIVFEMCGHHMAGEDREAFRAQEQPG